VSRRPPLLLIYAVTLTGILNNTLITPAIPDILSEFGEPSQRSGILVAVGSTAGIVLAPLIGFLADRFGRRHILTACLVAFGAFGALSALAPSFEILLAARFLQGFGSAGLINLALVLIGDHWEGQRRTVLVGRNSAVLTVGLAAIPAGSGYLTDAFGWRVTFAIYSVAFATAAWAWLRVHDIDLPAPQPIARQLGDAFVAARIPVLATSIGLGFLVFTTVFAVMLTSLPVHLADDFGLAADLRGLIIALPAVTSTIAAFNLGRLRGAVSPRTLIGGGAAILGISYLAIGLGPTVIFAVGGALLYGFGEGALIPALQSILASDSPDEHRGSINALWVGAVRLGQTVGSLIAGVGLATIGSGPTMASAALVAAVVVAIAVLGPYSRVVSTKG
jgi:MFS family permease